MLTRPDLLLRIEDACLLTAMVVLYHYFHFSWLLFAALFLAPDLLMLGYLLNPRTGAALYNLGHTLLVPLMILLIALSTQQALLLTIAVIWTAHIAADRLLGFGLKYPTQFKDTHLQRI